MGYLSSLGWHPHTFSFITNASAAKLELRDEHSYLERSEFLQAFIYPTLSLLIRRSSFLW